VIVAVQRLPFDRRTACQKTPAENLRVLGRNGCTIVGCGSARTRQALRGQARCAWRNCAPNTCHACPRLRTRLISLTRLELHIIAKRRVASVLAVLGNQPDHQFKNPAEDFLHCDALTLPPVLQQRQEACAVVLHLPPARYRHRFRSRRSAYTGTAGKTRRDKRDIA